MDSTIPHQMTSLAQWMLWDYVSGHKMPLQVNGLPAKSNDRSTWCSFDEVIHSDKYAFCFSDDDGLCGVDLDDCFAADGNLLDWASEIVGQFVGVGYAEISPSGAGIKITTRASKPTGSRCSNGKGVECYDTKRFWTVTGHVLGVEWQEINDGQEAIDWLIEKHLKIERQSIPKRLTNISENGHTSNGLLMRAEQYAASMQPAYKGDLRNSAFRNAGHLHALVGENGERLGDGDVYRLLSQWNLSNPEPLRDDEIRQAAINGRKNGTPPADKVPETKIKLDTEVDLSFLDGDNIEDDEDFEDYGQQYSPGCFPNHAVPTDGVIGEVMDYNMRTAIYPQAELAFAGALCLMSVVTGRKVATELDTRTNILALALAESGAGKDHSRNINKKLLYEAGCDSLIGPERIASSAGIASAIEENYSLLMMVDEIGHLLATMKNPGKSAHLFNISSMLMQLYSASNSIWIGDAYADSKKVKKIDQPHLVLYGTCVPDMFWLNLTADNIGNGMLGRCMVFESPGYTMNQMPEQMEIPGLLINKIRWWNDQRGKGIDVSKSRPQIVQHEPEAMARYMDHINCISRKRMDENRDRAAVWSRSGEKTGKLALLFACSRQTFIESKRINLDDVNRAIEISNWLTRRMLFQSQEFVASNLVEDVKKRVLRLVAKPITMNKLTRKTQWLKNKERAEVLNDLQSAGLIKVEISDTGGRPKTMVSRLT